MNLFLIIDETRFYHPDFVADFLKKTKDLVVGAGLVTKIPDKNRIENYLVKNWSYLTISEITKLFYRKRYLALKDLFSERAFDKPFYSVKSVLEFFKIDYFDVEYDINKRFYLDKIIEKKPDVIISSNSLIFKNEILKRIPRICCINRHSALLPSYGGLWPVFQAYRNGEQYTGVTVHTMEAKIDTGTVLAQKQIKIGDTDTVADLYEKCFAISADVIIEALEKIKNNDFSSCEEKTTPSYFSFPTKEHWIEFRAKGGKFI